MPRWRIEWTISAQAIALTRLDAPDHAAMNIAAPAWQSESDGFLVIIEKRHIDSAGVPRDNCNIDAFINKRNAKWGRRAGQNRKTARRHAQVITEGVLRPVRDSISAKLRENMMRSESAAFVSRSSRFGS